MSIIDHLLQIIAPHECVGCGSEGLLLCGSCRTSLQPLSPRCYRCHRYNDSNKTCSSCRRQSKLFAVHSLAQYEGAAKQIIWKLKFERAQSAGDEIGGMLCPLVESLVTKDTIIVHVPTATSRVRRRGYDQAALIAKAVSKKIGVPFAVPVVRTGQQMQRGANRLQRRKQLDGAFRVASPHVVQGMHIVLVDDVITTGATLEAVAAVLRAAGAKRIEAVVFARA